MFFVSRSSNAQSTDKNLFFVKQNGQYFINRFFSEQTLTVTSEEDGWFPGTLRATILEATRLRHNDPFILVKIVFDPKVKKIKILKGSLPPLDQGLTTVDCRGKVILDGSELDSRFLKDSEMIYGMSIKSSGNSLQGCRFTGFKGSAIYILGNRNIIRDNILGILNSKNSTSSKTIPEEIKTNLGSGIYIDDQSSENTLELNEIVGNKQDGITFSPEAGSNNHIFQNSFSENNQKAIKGSNSFLSSSSKPVLRSLTKEGDTYLLTAYLPETGDIEIYIASANGKGGKTAITSPFTVTAGEFSVSLKSKEIIPGNSKIIALVTTPGKNTSEFSDSILSPILDSAKLSPNPTSQPSSDAQKSPTLNSTIEASFLIASPASTKPEEAIINVYNPSDRSGESDKVHVEVKPSEWENQDNKGKLGAP